MSNAYEANSGIQNVTPHRSIFRGGGGGGAGDS